MELSYLCATRIADILEMKWSQISESGNFIQQGRTSVIQIKKWNYRLKGAVALAGKCFIPKSNQSYPMLTSDKSKMAYRTFNQAWNAAKKKVEHEMGYEFNCTFHDIKAKSISDYHRSSKDKQIFSGHKTESQVVAYDRNVKTHQL